MTWLFLYYSIVFGNKIWFDNLLLIGVNQQQNLRDHLHPSSNAKDLLIEGHMIIKCTFVSLRWFFLSFWFWLVLKSVHLSILSFNQHFLFMEKRVILFIRRDKITLCRCHIAPIIWNKHQMIHGCIRLRNSKTKRSSIFKSESIPKCIYIIFWQNRAQVKSISITVMKVCSQ
jgi:hypothetical protein